MKDKKSIILLVVCFLIIGLVLVFSIVMQEKDKKNEPKYVQISVKDYGNIIVKLYPDKAPITVENFLKLVNDKFYDGLTFHRIMENFMIQGGTYDTEGNRKDAATIKGEFELNGVENDLSHTRGVISMVRSNTDFDSASSGFFIMHADNLALDGGYAAFGEVIDGMDVVDTIATTIENTDDNGGTKLEDRPVIESIREIDIATTSK